MVEGNGFIALALMALFTLLLSIFPKSAAAQKMKEKFIRNQVWSQKDTGKCRGGQGTNQINCGPDTVQMTKKGEQEDDD